MTKLRIAIHGAAGRMGKRLIALGSLDPELRVVAALDAPDNPDLGVDAGELSGVGRIGVPLASQLLEPVDAIIDFSVPGAAMSIAAVSADRKIPLVLATTGFETEEKHRIKEFAVDIPIVWAPSMSMAVNLTMKLVATAARVLKDYPNGTDVEIIERHHRFKEDAPSGTALRFGEIVADIMGQSLHAHGRSGRTGKRPLHEIGFHAMRTGDNPGEHTIVFGMLGETIELNVKASNRDCYAYGALRAAKFVAKQKPGLYGMADVLEL